MRVLLKTLLLYFFRTGRQISVKFIGAYSEVIWKSLGVLDEKLIQISSYLWRLFFPTLLAMFAHVPRYCRYLFCYSYAHNVAPKGKFIAFVTTEAKTNQPEEDLKPVLGSVNEIFYDMYDRFEPCNDHEVDGCFISTVSIK